MTTHVYVHDADDFGGKVIQVRMGFDYTCVVIDVGFVQFCFLSGLIFLRRRRFIGDFTTVGHTVAVIVHDVIVSGTDVVSVNDTVEIGVVATVRYSVVVEIIGVVKTLADVIVIRNTIAVYLLRRQGLCCSLSQSRHGGWDNHLCCPSFHRCRRPHRKHPPPRQHGVSCWGC